MLTATGVASPPAARIRSTVRSSEPSSGCSPSRMVRAAQIPRPPSAANVRAISAPMPRLAPVTMTVLPSSLPMILSLLSQVHVHKGDVLRHCVVVVRRDEDAVVATLLLDDRLELVEPLDDGRILRLVHGDQQRLAAGGGLRRRERDDAREPHRAQRLPPRLAALLELARELLPLARQDAGDVNAGDHRIVLSSPRASSGAADWDRARR